MASIMLRVALKSVSIDAVLGAVRPDLGPFLYAVEGLDSENPHVHFFLAKPDSQPALRARLRKLGLTGNGGYSLKSLKEEYPTEVLAYICKGGVYETNLPKAMIEQALSHDASVKKDMASKRKQKASVLDELKELVVRPGVLTGRDYDLDACAMCMAIIRFHQERDLPVRRYQLNMLFDTLMLWYLPTREKHELVLSMQMRGARPLSQHGWI